VVFLALWDVQRPLGHALLKSRRQILTQTIAGEQWRPHKGGLQRTEESGTTTPRFPWCWKYCWGFHKHCNQGSSSSIGIYIRGGVIMYFIWLLCQPKFFGSILELKDYEASLYEYGGHSVAAVSFMSWMWGFSICSRGYYRGFYYTLFLVFGF